MKKNISILIVLLCLAAISCKEKEIPTPQILQIERADVSFTSIGGEGTVELISKDVFTVNSNETWCKFQINGNKISLSIDENISVEGRSALLTISQGEEEIVLTISQLGDVSDSNIDNVVFPVEGGETTFVIKSKQDWTVKLIPEEAAGWLNLNVNKTTGEIKIACADFADSKKSRVAKVEVNYSDQTWVGEFVQRKPLARNYVIKYKIGKDDHMGECRIVETVNSSIFHMFFKLATFENKVPFKAVMGTDGVLRIPNMQVLDTPAEGQLVRLEMADLVKQKYVHNKNAFYVAKVIEDAESGNISMKFENQGLFSGLKVNTLYFLTRDLAGKFVRNNGYLTDMILEERLEDQEPIFPTIPIAGEYKMKYNWYLSNEVVEGKCVIKPTGNLFIFNLLFSSVKNNLEHKVPVKGRFVNGKLMLSSYQILDKFVYNDNNYTMILQMVDLYRDDKDKLKGAVSGDSKEVLYVADVIEDDNGGISMKFEDGGTWKDHKVNGLAFTSFPEKEGVKILYHGYFNNIELEKLNPTPAP